MSRGAPEVGWGPAIRSGVAARASQELSGGLVQPVWDSVGQLGGWIIRYESMRYLCLLRTVRVLENQFGSSGSADL